MNAYAAECGFSLLELVVSVAITAAIAGTMFQLAGPSRNVFDAELERTETLQRMRASVETMRRDLAMAGGGLQSPAVAPYRRGLVSPDPVGVAYADRLSVSYIPPGSTIANVVTATYWLRHDRLETSQLMRYDGLETDLPVADFVSSLRFDYFDTAGAVLPREGLADGPWLSDSASGSFDADLLAVRRIRVTLRVRTTRTLWQTPWGEREIRFDIAPRNMNLQ